MLKIGIMTESEAKETRQNWKKGTNQQRIRIGIGYILFRLGA